MKAGRQVEELTIQAKRQLEANDLLISPMVFLEFDYLFSTQENHDRRESPFRHNQRVIRRASLQFPFSGSRSRSTGYPMDDRSFRSHHCGSRAREWHGAADHPRPADPEKLSCRSLAVRLATCRRLGIGIHVIAQLTRRIGDPSGRHRPHLMNGIAGFQRERRDLDIELLAAGADHLISAVHHSRRRLERTPR